jgi:hypothetical protein
MSTPHDPFRAASAASEAGLESMTRNQLLEEASALGLSTKGTKAELAARIRGAQ